MTNVESFHRLHNGAPSRFLPALNWFVVTSLATVAIGVGAPALGQTLQPVDCLAAAFVDTAGLADQHGRGIAFDGFAGRLTVVTFVPRACDVDCAMRMIDLDQIARGLPLRSARAIAFVAIDTGGRSTVAFRKLAASWRHAPGRWTLLRGTPSSIATLRRRIDITPSDAAEPSAMVAVFDAGGTLRQRYSGAPLDRYRVARELATIASLPPGACSVSSAPHS